MRMPVKFLMAALIVLLSAALLFGCAAPATPAAPEAPASSEPAAEPVAEPAPEPPAEPVTLTVAGSWTECTAIDAIARAFTAEYPNCTVKYEYLQDYYESAAKRMSGEEAIDLFFTTNIQADSDMLPYALDLMSAEGLDLSATFTGLIENFICRGENGSADALYAVPVGAEMRGLYVNKTLLASLGLDVPTDQASLLAACAALKEAGYIPFHGNPGAFGQYLAYPWICNIIANADDPAAVYAKVDAREPGVSELFREPFAFLYTLVENGYYDYKKAQTDLNLFNDTRDEDYARYFLNIGGSEGAYEKLDDVGQVAFMPSPMSLMSVVEKVKEDYHSEIEFVFVPAPIGPEGGFVYLSPAHGIAINKDSTKAEWAVRFLDFMFKSGNSELFAEEFNVIPNTGEALEYVTDLYDVPADRICELGQVTFSYYGFYTVISDNLVDISKANNPKYMQTAEDGTVSLYTLDYYMNALEESFQENGEQ